MIQKGLSGGSPEESLRRREVRMFLAYVGKLSKGQCLSVHQNARLVYTQKDITAPCCWDCIKCPQGTISMAIGSSCCARCEPLTKSNKSSREISFLLLFGSAVLFTLAVIQPSEPSNFLCSAATTLRYFVLNLCITMHFLKTIRVTSVFETDRVGAVVHTVL